MEKTTEPSADKKAPASPPASAPKAEEPKAEPNRLRHFLEGKPRHYGRLMLAHDQVLAAAAAKDKKQHTPLTLDTEGTDEVFEKALAEAQKARI